MFHPIVRVDDVLVMKVSGILTRADWVAMLAETRVKERQTKVIPHRIMDATELENLVRGYFDFADLASERGREEFPNSFKSALVAPLPVQFGCARMFQTLMRNPQIDVQIFATMAEAHAWVAAPAEAQRSVI